MLNVTDEPPDGTSDDKLEDLDNRLKAIEARGRKTHDAGAEVGANQGFQVLGELIGGILGGLGLGWVIDHYAHTQPWCMIAGAVLGMVLAVYVVAKRSQT